MTLMTAGPHASEISAVRAVLETYVAGARAGNTTLLEEAFHADAHMYGYLNGASTNVPIVEFLEMVAGFTAPADSGEPYRAEITSITVHGTAAAAAEIRESSYLGMDFIDFFTLVRAGAFWYIVSKTYCQIT